MATPDFSIGNPFEPGSAIMPAYVAGRKAGRQIIDETIAGITRKRNKKGTLGSSPMGQLTIIGSRGAGKTTLLALAEKQALEQDVLVASNAQEPNLTEIIYKLMEPPRKGWQRLVSRWLNPSSNVRGSIPGRSLGPGLTDEFRYGDFERAVRERLRTQPVLLLLDDAMYYDLKSLTSVLLTSQLIISRKLPLAVILAGTPDLIGLLGDTETAFYSMGKDIDIHLFDDDEAADALRTPLVSRGIEVEDDALEMMVDLSDNYPYFVHLIGREVWKILAEKQQATVDIALVETAGKTMLGTRNNFFRKMHTEMKELGLETYAQQVVAIWRSFAGKQVTSGAIEAELIRKNNGLGEWQAADIVRKLEHKGVLWADDDFFLKPGLPSFFAYVEENMDASAG